MTVELTAYEAELLIAVLTFAEGAALKMNPSIVEVLKYLRAWRSVLLREYVLAALNAAQENAEPPDADGEQPRGDEARSQLRDQQVDAQGLKR